MGNNILQTWLASRVLLIYKKKDPQDPKNIPTHMRLNSHMRHPYATTAETHNQGNDTGLTHNTTWRPEGKK